MNLSEFYVTPSGAIARQVMGIETYLWGFFGLHDDVSEVEDVINISNFFARRGPEEE